MWLQPKDLEDQLFEGIYESDDCWDFSGVGCLEIILNSLFPTFSQVAKDFFISKGFCDAQGNFALSRRYIAVLSNKMNSGDAQIDFWTLVKKYGMIPRTVLDYVTTGITDANYQSFLQNFFDPKCVTPQMKSLGQDFLTFVNPDAKNISPLDIPKYISQSPIQIGIPIPQTISWNQTNVGWDNSSLIAKHAVVLLGINPDGSKQILDSYNIAVKTLSVNYPIIVATLPVVTVNNLPQEQVSLSVVQQFLNLLRSIGLWYN